MKVAMRESTKRMIRVHLEEHFIPTGRDAPAHKDLKIATSTLKVLFGTSKIDIRAKTLKRDIKINIAKFPR